MIPRPPRISLLPYTTLFRSYRLGDVLLDLVDGVPEGDHQSVLERGRPVLQEQVDAPPDAAQVVQLRLDRKSTRLNSSHANISYAVFCLTNNTQGDPRSEEHT